MNILSYSKKRPLHVVIKKYFRQIVPDEARGQPNCQTKSVSRAECLRNKRVKKVNEKETRSKFASAEN